METYFKQFENCRQGEPPFCEDTCPFHLDVLDFQEKIGRKSYNAAYRTFRDAVGFPDIVAALCPEYCAAVCPRKSIDQAVQINLLEKTCVARATKKDPNDYNIPSKNGKVAIIGAGISGLACGLRLATKKYEVTIYEKTGQIGGHLSELLPGDIYLEDIQRQFKFENYALFLNTEVTSIIELEKEEFDSIYIATGKNGPDFGVMNQKNGHCILDGKTAIFAGGSLNGKDIMHALADGLQMAWAIEVYLKTGKLEYPVAGASSKVVANPDKLNQIEAIMPTDDGIFTDEEVVAEAGRCIRCQCDACRNYCDLVGFTNKWPLRMRDEIMMTVMASESMIHKTPALRVINACTQCFLCEEICPENIQWGKMMKQARRMLHQRGKMPGAYHQFWLRDMDFANSELASLRKNPPQRAQCSYAFFPGCHLGAAEPGYVSKPYEWLLSKEPDTGLLLRCCGVPADWAGNEEKHLSEVSGLRGDWEGMGKPVLIMACPSCSRHLKEYLPEIKCISLYEVLDQWGDHWSPRNDRIHYSVFDPCSARNEPFIQNAVRNLSENTGALLEELPKGDKHGCCGFGGNGSLAIPEFGDFVAKKNSGLSSNPYITYCINCRDIFKEEGKPVIHILNRLFDIEGEDTKLADLSQRRKNRVVLKQYLLKKIWGEEMVVKPEKFKFTLVIGPAVQEKMNKLKVLDEDLYQVIERGEISKRRVFNPENDTYACYEELGFITYWVVYQKKDTIFEVVNVYTHRMKIELEGVWNGRKTETDLR